MFFLISSLIEASSNKMNTKIIMIKIVRNMHVPLFSIRISLLKFYHNNNTDILLLLFLNYQAKEKKRSIDSGNLKITNLDRLIFTKNGEFTI